LAEDDVFVLNDGTECSTELLKAMTDNYYNPVAEGAEDPDIKDAIKGTALEALNKMLVDRCTKEDSMKGTECVRRMMDSQVIKVLGKVVMIVWLCTEGLVATFRAGEESLLVGLYKYYRDSRTSKMQLVLSLQALGFNL
jgi:hypothetical protein